MSNDNQEEMIPLTWDNYATDVRRFSSTLAREYRFKTEDAEDFIMRCSVKVFQKMRDGKFNGWGGVIVCIRNEARDFNKELRRKKRVATEDLSEYAESIGESHDHESSELNKEILDMALQSFPLAYAVGVLSTHGMTIDQVAGAFGWAKRRLQDAVALERSQMGDILQSERFSSSSLMEEIDI